MKIEFKEIKHGNEDWKRAVSLRENILRKPLGQLFTEEELEEEKNHIQLVGLKSDQIIATAVLVAEEKHLKMQSVVVLDSLSNLKSDLSLWNSVRI